jgi:hypothetical protein
MRAMRASSYSGGLIVRNAQALPNARRGVAFRHTCRHAGSPGWRPAARKSMRIVYRYWLNAARRARLANAKKKDLPDDYDLGTRQFGQRPESFVVLR